MDWMLYKFSNEIKLDKVKDKIYMRNLNEIVKYVLKLIIYYIINLGYYNNLSLKCQNIWFIDFYYFQFFGT